MDYGHILRLTHGIEKNTLKPWHASSIDPQVLTHYNEILSSYQ